MAAIGCSRRLRDPGLHIGSCLSREPWVQIWIQNFKVGYPFTCSVFKVQCLNTSCHWQLREWKAKTWICCRASGDAGNIPKFYEGLWCFPLVPTNFLLSILIWGIASIPLILFRICLSQCWNICCIAAKLLSPDNINDSQLWVRQCLWHTLNVLHRTYLQRQQIKKIHFVTSKLSGHLGAGGRAVTALRFDPCHRGEYFVSSFNIFIDRAEKLGNKDFITNVCTTSRKRSSQHAILQSKVFETIVLDLAAFYYNPRLTSTISITIKWKTTYDFCS